MHPDRRSSRCVDPLPFLSSFVGVRQLVSEIRSNGSTSSASHSIDLPKPSNVAAAAATSRRTFLKRAPPFDLQNTISALIDVFSQSEETCLRLNRCKFCDSKDYYICDKQMSLFM